MLEDTTSKILYNRSKRGPIAWQKNRQRTRESNSSVLSKPVTERAAFRERKGEIKRKREGREKKPEKKINYLHGNLVKAIKTPQLC